MKYKKKNTCKHCLEVGVKKTELVWVFVTFGFLIKQIPDIFYHNKKKRHLLSKYKKKSVFTVIIFCPSIGAVKFAFKHFTLDQKIIVEQKYL